ncbi:hypothetical protein ACFJIS_15670 [Variovorax boronicumulans]|uniref:hypothetical protein n=1 Tax=Variovorax boronicumulans TaxID=436515 RepID=UPI0036F1E1E1
MLKIKAIFNRSVKNNLYVIHPPEPAARHPLVVQGASSSSVGIALSEAIDKHNSRNLGKEIVFS